LVDNRLRKKINTAFSEEIFPADFKVVLVWLTAGILAIYLPVLNETPLKAILLLPGILFLPGYCLSAALFPKKDDISISERIALSIGLSIAVVPLLAIGLNYTPLGISLNTILLAVTLFTLMMILVAQYRRFLLVPTERFGISFSAMAGTLRDSLFSKEENRIDHFISVVVVLAILASVIITVYIITVPKEGERFTEFFILGENGMAADYPDMIRAGQDYPMFIGVGNHEYRNMTYTIETWTVLTKFDNLKNSTTILAMTPIARQSLVLSHNETRKIPYNLSVNKTSHNRVEFLLFNETVPGPEVTGSDRINASYRALHLGVTIRNA
jgi:uncharacterized membrane protein